MNNPTLEPEGEGVRQVERALVGSVMHRPKVMADLDVQSDDFADPRLGGLWHLMQTLDGERIPPDAVTVGANLHRATMRGIDHDLITDLITTAPLAPVIGVYARQVTQNATLRRLVEACTRGVQLARDGGDPQEITEHVRAEVDAASRATASIRLIGEEIDDTITALADPTPQAVATPWPDLNYLIGGWRPGGLYVIGARPAKGKSIMGLQAAVELAKHGAVAFHSLEMPREEVHTRVLAQLSGVSMTRMERRQLTDNDWDRISSARAQVAEMNLAIDERGGVRPIDVRSHARTLARRGPLAGIVVDYLQLMSASRGDRRPRHELVAEWSRQLKLLAKEMHVPVFAISQLNRESEGRTDKRPTMADLRESGAIEQDADVICLLHVDDEADPSLMHVLVAKNRQGQPGVLQLTRRGELARLDAQKWRPSGAADDDRRAGA